MAYEPSLNVAQALLHPETRKALSLPLATLFAGALWQVETTIEIANRVCDAVFHRSMDDRPECSLGSRNT